MDHISTWIGNYLDALPDTIRPPANDTRLQLAADQAERNGWAPRQLAAVVRTANIGNARNPTLIALMRMEDHATRKPATLRTVRSKRNPSGCLVCPPEITCPHPVTQRIPPAWTAERAALVRILSETPGLTEDQREHAMTTLIARQRATLATP